MQVKLVLIVLFFYQAVAVEDDEDLDFPDYESDPRYDDFIRLIKINKLAKMLNDKCVENNQLTLTIMNVVEYQQFFHANISAYLSPMFRPYDFRRPVDSILPIEFFTSLCANASNIQNDIRNYLSTISVCLNENEKKQSQFFPTAFGDLAAYLCYNDASQFKLIFSDEGIRCLLKTYYSAKQCISEVSYNEYKPEDISNMSFSSYLKFDELHCNIMFKQYLCFASGLNECIGSQIKDVTQTLSEVFYQSSPCTQFKIA